MRAAAWERARPALEEGWVAARPSVLSARVGFLVGLGRVWPYALFVALALGGVVAVGVNLSNAYPSEQRPFGWPGTSSFPNGVAMVREELVVAAALPALVAGFVAMRRLEPRVHGAAFLGGIAAAGLLALALGVAVGGLLGTWAASKSSPSAYGSFFAGHMLLAWAFFALAVFAIASLRRYGTALAGAAFVFFVAVYDNLLQWRVFREAGFHRLQAGQFPDWFLAGQLGSPVASYRGFLILDRPQFRDGLERAVLGDAVLPTWANSDLFAAGLLAFWIILPLGLAASAWKLWAWWETRPALRPRDVPRPLDHELRTS